MSENRRILHIVGRDLAFNNAVAQSAIRTIQTDTNDGIEIDVQDLEASAFGPDAVDAWRDARDNSMRTAITRGEQFFLNITGHGGSTGDQGQHQIGLFGIEPIDFDSGFIVVSSLDTAAVIQRMVNRYGELYRAHHGADADVPRITVVLSSCFSQGMLRDLPPTLLSQADIIVEDSQDRYTWQDDSARTINDLTPGGNSEEVFARMLLHDRQSPSVYSIPLLATSEGVIDGDSMRQRVTRENFDATRAAALQGIARLPASVQDRARQEIERLTIDNFSTMGNERAHALLGYAAHYDQRFTPLSVYQAQTQAFARFVDHTTPAAELPALMRQIDPSILASRSYHMPPEDPNVIDLTGTPVPPDARHIRMLMEADINPLFAYDANTAEIISLMNATQRQQFINQIDNNLTPLMNDITFFGGGKNTTALIQSGADVNIANGLGVTALMMAVESNNVPAARALIAARADVDAVDSNGQRVLNYSQSVEMSQLLINNGADVQQAQAATREPLAFAIFLGQSARVNELLAAGADANGWAVNTGTPLEALRPAPLRSAISTGSLEMVDALLRHGARVNEVDWRNLTPLFSALGSPDITQRLITAGADVNVRGPEEFSMLGDETDSRVTPLYMAIELGNIETIRHLVAAGADINQKVGYHGILSSAVSNALFSPDDAHKQALPAQLIALGANPNARDGYHGATALHAVAEYREKNALMQSLIAAGADVNLADDHGVTPLMLAVSGRNREEERLLLAAGARPDGDRNNDGRVSRQEADIMRMQALIRRLGSEVSIPSAYDLNQDGTATPEEAAVALVRAGVDLEIYSSEAMNESLNETLRHRSMRDHSRGREDR